MKKVFNAKTKAGSQESHEPRLLGSIVEEMLHGSSPLAKGYRDYKLFENIYPHTELDVNLKLLTREQGRLPVGAYLDGAITHDAEDHFTFIQNDPEKKDFVVTQRNPHIYVGKRINVNRKEDGTLYPTFNRPRYTKDFTFLDFCREAAEELLAVAGLVVSK